jgi:selenide,water dikinase
VQTDPNLLVGHSGADDAGVYWLDERRAIVLTVDFFTPVVDDPFDYGRVAAANSLSDVYAMGGRPIAALNICAFPERDLPKTVLGDILRGGADIAKEAGVAIAGGHTVSDDEIKYGLSGFGLVHPEKIIQNSGARPGDALVLTQGLGTGVLSTALKMEELTDEYYSPLVESMTLLNRHAAEQMLNIGAHGATDITGNGLLGHALEMAQASDVTIEIDASTVPVLPGTIDFIERSFLTGGGDKNRRLIGGHVKWSIGETLEHLLLDPQTSGGLLIALPAGKAQGFLESVEAQCPRSALVGRVVEKGDVSLRVV